MGNDPILLLSQRRMLNLYINDTPKYPSDYLIFCMLDLHFSNLLHQLLTCLIDDFGSISIFISCLTLVTGMPP